MKMQTQTIDEQTTNFANVTKATITEGDVKNAINQWGEGLLKIAETHRHGKDVKLVASEVIRQAYNYDEGEVLFKPTLASHITFRTTFEGALSYFIGGNSQFSEDSGFALNPWKKADFEIAGIYTSGDTALLMGNKHLMKEDGSIVIANFSMGFKKNLKGEIKIVLHHSSLPYQP
jgi:hypothetical protein